MLHLFRTFLLVFIYIASSMLTQAQDNDYISSDIDSLLKDSSTRSVHFNDLELRYDLYYFRNEEDPFTGKFTAYHNNGVNMAQGFILDGKFHGTIRGWYDNGRISRKIFYNSGVKDGKWIKWDEYGQKISEDIYKNGELIETKEY